LPPAFTVFELTITWRYEIKVLALMDRAIRVTDSCMTFKKPEKPKPPPKDAAAAAAKCRGQPTGQALADALAASPLRDLDFEPEPYRAPVRDVELETGDLFKARQRARGRPFSSS
jgi:hypothetical protein